MHFSIYFYCIVLFSSLSVCVQKEHLKVAQQYFQLVGSSASECGKPCLLTVLLFVFFLRRILSICKMAVVKYQHWTETEKHLFLYCGFWPDFSSHGLSLDELCCGNEHK